MTGVICEYNPFHLGHKKQLDMIRARAGADEGIVCLMSGNFVQRGAPAIVDKTLRAQAAVLSGADLVLELPVTAALSSAEGFAAGGVEILGKFCDRLCFGAENADVEALMQTAQTLLSSDFSNALKQKLELGLSFPAARQAALEDMGADATLLRDPNNILGIEYCKAILSQNYPMTPLPISRQGSYHADTPDPENPSATSLRRLMLDDQPYAAYIPAGANSCFSNAALHALCFGERAVLAKLRTMTDAEFEALPYGSEGLWRKFMHAARKFSTLEEILTAVKSKRYTRTRLDRMMMCAFLGITADMLAETAPYVRVLAFNDRGRRILKDARKTGVFLNAGERADNAYWELEQRLGDLYGLFAKDTIEPPDAESRRRVFYHAGDQDK